eukprot:4131798-Prymnesium_polylepis.3
MTVAGKLRGCGKGDVESLEQCVTHLRQASQRVRSGCQESPRRQAAGTTAAVRGASSAHPAAARVGCKPTQSFTYSNSRANCAQASGAGEPQSFQAVRRELSTAASGPLCPAGGQTM